MSATAQKQDLGDPEVIAHFATLVRDERSLTALYIGPTYKDVASFGLLVLVLVVRPSGLLGKTA